MASLGASKVALSSISSQSLWIESGRISESKGGSREIFQFEDRKTAKYLLSPTHEEEITHLVGGIVQSYRDLPLRLYQITRKYRDEARPRQGLLRAREFLMKDLYTFDLTSSDALRTYNAVRAAYSAIFTELNLQYHVAEASSGDMGGNLSHEYHVPSHKGEDNLIMCDSCHYLVNEEVVESRYSIAKHVGVQKDIQIAQRLLEFASNPRGQDPFFKQWFCLTKDTSALIQVIIPTKAGTEAAGVHVAEEPRVDPSKVQESLPDLELNLSLEVQCGQVDQMIDGPSGVGRVYRLYDGLVTSLLKSATGPMARSEIAVTKGLDQNDMSSYHKFPLATGKHQVPVVELDHLQDTQLRLTRIANGDACMKCADGRLHIQPAIELGHTFHLGTRYSAPLKATVATDQSHKHSASIDTAENPEEAQVPMQMGCHGIGVSRVIAAVADLLADSKGLNWPRAIAPFEAAVVSSPKASLEDQKQVYDALSVPKTPSDTHIDTILDDRPKELSWKLKDADLIGYPVLVILGRRWLSGDRTCEVQCRRLKVKEEVSFENINSFVANLLDKL